MAQDRSERIPTTAPAHTRLLPRAGAAHPTLPCSPEPSSVFAAT